MAKKKTIDLRSVDPTPVPAGDVNIIYNAVRIGGFSEDTDATLKTGGCRVPYDINVNYEKNAAPGNVVNITNNSSGTPAINGSGLITPAGIHATDLEIPSGNSKMFLYNDFTGDRYVTRITIAAETDLYSITVNNTPLTYDGREAIYPFFQSSETAPITGQTYNVIITDKE